MIIIYGFSLAILFLLLRLIEYKLLIIEHSFQIYVGSIALLFTLLGIWISRKIFRPGKEITIIEKEKLIEKKVFIETQVEKEKIIEKEIFITTPQPFVLNKKALEETDVSARELEVLQLIAKGLSNQEIADALFVSVNTIKTHVTNLFYKLEVTRRTQAVEKAKQLSIIP